MALIDSQSCNFPKALEICPASTILTDATMTARDYLTFAKLHQKLALIGVATKSSEL